MRILLDENIPLKAQGVLTALGHEIVHVKTAGLRGSRDDELAVIARDFDVFIALDLHRQEHEWMAVNREIVESGIKLVRIRLWQRSGGGPNPVADIPDRVLDA